MRQVQRRVQRTRQRLKRAADGQLRPENDGDIADIWAEQRRIRLREAIQDDQRKAARKQRRHDVLHFAKSRISGQSGHEKEVEIRLSLPRITFPRPGDVRRHLSRIPRPKVSKKHVMVGVLCVAGVSLGAVGLSVMGREDTGRHNTAQTAKSGNEGSTQHATLGATAETPSYATVLPKGKSIESLGGWGRVSPPDRDPVYAYADTIGSAKITVSEQPLPSDFKSNPKDKVAALAEQFHATKKLAISGGAEAFVGTSAQGPQSVVATKSDLLILIKSTAVVPDADWAGYINALQ